MRNESDPALARSLVRLSRLCSLLALCFGLVVLTGWTFDIYYLKTFLPGQVTVKANTAICMVLLGIASWLASNPGQRPRWMRTIVLPGLALVVSIVGLISLVEALYGWDPGWDELIFTAQPEDATGSLRPALMSPVTALDFCLLGAAVMLSVVPGRWSCRVLQGLSLAAGLASILGILDFILNLATPYTYIAPTTAVMLLLFSIGTLLLRTDAGVSALFASTSSGGEVARRLLPPAAVIPLFVAWLRWKGESAGLYSGWTGVVLMTITAIILIGGLTVWTALVIDRTDIARKHAQQKVERVNRILQALSDCTEALMRATDEENMLQRVCDAVIQGGAYCMTWIGYAEHDPNKTVRPIASAGEEQGYLKTANISWADVPRGRGPTGTAIRTGKVVVCRDANSDPNYAPWREEALRRGYRSSVVLPLRNENQIFGALMIYAAEVDAFDVEEQRLLEELANNVSYAIATLRARTEQQKTEQELSAERQRFSDVLDRLPAYVVLLSPDYHVPFANKFFRERFGESNGKRCYEYLFGRSEPCEICETYKVLKTGSPQRWKWTGPDGHHYDIYDFPFTERDGSPLILEMGIDITEREQAEAEVRKASLYTRSLIEASLDPLVTISREGKITDVNEASERATGVPRQKLIGSDFSNYFTEPEQARRGYQQVFETGLVQDYPLAIRHVSGTITDVLYNASVFKNEQGEVEGVFAAARDVTARKRAESALTMSEARYRSLVIATAQIVWSTNPSGEVVEDLPSFQNFTGRTQADLQGWGWVDTLHPDDRERTAQVWSSAVASRTAYETEYRMRRADGEYRYMSARGAPVVGQDGNIREWVGFCADITGRKLAEEEVRKLNNELEERVRQRTAELENANKELEAFTYSVSHDLRAPLRHISGFSKILSEEFAASLPCEAQHHLERIQQGTSRMGALVDDLLNLARVGRQELRLQVTGLNSLVDEVIVGLKPECEGRQVEWKIGALPFVECDPGLVKQVLQNLFSNALKFTRPRPVAILEVGQLEQSGAPTLFVRDNGVGFSMKYADKLFGVFQRLHRPEDFEGTGVGLATVQRIVHKHGGKIWAESELDKGATFYFTLAGAHSEESRALATAAGENS